MKLSCVIACRDGAKTLPRCLDSLALMTRRDVEIIVADDGSGDASAEIAREKGAVVLRLFGRGRASALNEGIKAASGEAILFTDADCTVPRDWADELEKHLLRGYHGVGGNLVPSAWTVIEIAKVLRYLREFQDDFELAGSYSGLCLNGNNMAVLKSALIQAGGFDEGFLHGADADLTRRLLWAGCRLLRTRSIETTHLKVDSLGSFLRTFYKRGSAVRFAMEGEAIPRGTLLRAFLSPFRRLSQDYGKLAEMKRRFPAVAGGRLLFAPAAHFLADLFSASGQIHYHRRFLSEAGR